MEPKEIESTAINQDIIQTSKGTNEQDSSPSPEEIYLSPRPVISTFQAEVKKGYSQDLQGVDSEENTGSNVTKPKTLRSIAVDLLVQKNKKNTHYQSIDVLNQKGIASKNIGLFEESPSIPDSTGAQKISKQFAMPESLKKSLSVSDDSRASFVQNVHTGYKSARSPLKSPGSIDTGSIVGEMKGPISGGESSGASYSAMSSIRSARISTMLTRSGSSTEGVILDPQKNSPVSPKSFKDFYISLLQGNSMEFKK